MNDELNTKDMIFLCQSLFAKNHAQQKKHAQNEDSASERDAMPSIQACEIIS